MKVSPYQTPELRNESDAVIQVGTYGKYTPFANADNTGILDYINNNLEALKNALSGAYVYVKNKSSLPARGDVTKIYVTQDDGKSYKWTGTEWSLLTSQLNGLSAYEIAQTLGFTGTEEEWIISLGMDTISSATVDSDGYLTMHTNNGGKIKTPLQPIIDCIKYRDSAASSASTATAQANTATTQANNAKTSATNSANSASASATSASNAKTSETNAGSNATTSRNWAVSETSPDGATDADSGTGKTQSSRTWALESKANAQSASSSAGIATSQAQSAKSSVTTVTQLATEAHTYATSASASASNASASEQNAKASETNASNSESNALQYKDLALASKTASATSESNASKSEINAKASANSASSSAISASTSASNASTSEQHAATSETNAKSALVEIQKVQKEVETALSKVTGFAKYAGSVDNYSDLPTTGVDKGDVWNVVNADATHQIKAGDNVIWNGEAWDNLSGFVDLSNYPTNNDVAKAIVSTTYSGGTITFIHKDGTQSTATIGDTSHATQADQDGDGNVITSTYYKKSDASTIHQSFQNQINSKQDKLTFDSTPTASSTNPVTSSGVKAYVDQAISNIVNVNNKSY